MMMTHTFTSSEARRGSPIYDDDGLYDLRSATSANHGEHLARWKSVASDQKTVFSGD